MTERAAAAAAGARRTVQAQVQANAKRTEEVQMNLQRALDAMATLRATIDKRPGPLFPNEQKS